MSLWEWLKEIFMKPGPPKGDLIEFYRPGYQHWGVYVGGGYVIHATKNDYIDDRATVTKDLIEDVAAGDEWHVNNKYDTRHEPRSPDVILREAKKMVGKEIPYSLLDSNCEHFATNLRYGVPMSGQAVIGKVLSYVPIVGGLVAGAQLANSASCSLKHNATALQ
ncbi:phospholipase A and acyltransferase 2-like [Alosa pseudoharengus]|uniref:phospholipase A and acyltransferase 2-like n=1 Tax=Alosa pseudoharengus TaxID=34774 RepID=UPI003F8A258C